ncbi:MAG: alpha/beta hydrolase family esterase [Woeseiaceae bacterium]
MNKTRARFLLACVLVAVVAGACVDESRTEVPGMTRHTLEHDGLEREYFVFLPSDYDEATEFPAVIFMHGYGGTATGTEAEVTNGLTRYAEEYGYVMIFPQSTWFMSDGGPDERWEVTSWNHISDGFDKGPAGPICTPDAASYPCPPECGSCGSCGWASCHDDVGFLEALVARIESDLMIDANRVYASGFSNGAMMSNRIACEASELFAAAALIGGRVEPGFECTPQLAVPLLQINGGKDETVPCDGRVSDTGFFYASAKAVAEEWGSAAACTADRASWLPPAGNDALLCTIACADSRHESVDCLWSEGDHRWPGTAGRRGSDGYCVTELQSASMPEQTICVASDTSQDVWGSRLMFEFFERHARAPQ